MQSSQSFMLRSFSYHLTAQLCSCEHRHVGLVNKKPLEVVNSACQLMVLPVWSVKSDGQYGIGCKTHVKFVIGHWSVSIRLLLVRSACWSSVCWFHLQHG